jgi:hypothetical protein
LPEECRAVVSVGQRHAEGQATPDELALAAARAKAWEDQCGADLQRFDDVRRGQVPMPEPMDPEQAQAERVRLSGRAELARFLRYPLKVIFKLDDVLGPLLTLPRGDACDLLRCVYRHVGTEGFDPSWRTSTAVGLARTMYASCDFAAMPILADALEETGCDSPDVLAHCRADTPHVRGCWVVDLVLGKS